MKHRKLASLVLAGAVGMTACADYEAPTTPARTGEISRSALSSTSGQYLVTFRGNGVPAEFEGRVADLGGRVVFAHGPTGLAFVSGITEQGAAELGGLGGVAAVQADTEIAMDAPLSVESADAEAPGIASQANPATAARYPFQWNMRAIGADKAWAAGKLGSSAVTVAILDTGIDYDAPDLNGLVDLSRSASFIPTDDAITAAHFPGRHPINDYNGHGTNVATQVSSKAVALAGVTSRTTLIGVKVLGINGSGSLGAVLSGVLHSADSDADIANMSLGGGFAKAGLGQYVGLINRVFTYAHQQGMLVVVAAGNETHDIDHNGNLLKSYCDAVNVVCVSAVGPEVATGPIDVPSYYTNFGRSAITVAGPGGNASFTTPSVWPWGMHIASFVWSYCAKHTAATDAEGDPIFEPDSNKPVLTACVAGNRLTGMIGTSQATPHVAGLAALIMADQGVDAHTAKKVLVKTADDRGARGTDPYFGRGLINVARAVGAL